MSDSSLPDECDFDFLYSKRDAANIGELINIALENIEDANKAKLENVFRNIDFNSEPALGQTKDRNRRLKNCLKTSTIPGSTCDRRASATGTSSATPTSTSSTSSPPAPARRPASSTRRRKSPSCGQAGAPQARRPHLRPGVRVGVVVHPGGQGGHGSNDYSLFGQESNGSTWALAG